MPLDIGVGILSTLFVSHTFDLPLTTFLLVLGVAAALLPDIDILTKLRGRWRHREYTHYPLLYIPIVLGVYVLFGTPYAVLLGVGVLAHLVHDTIGIGWGIRWLWPFTPRRFLLFPEKGRRKRYGWYMSWLPHEQKNIVSDPVPHNWITMYYLRPSFIGAVEYGFLLVSVVMLLYFI